MSQSQNTAFPQGEQFTQGIVLIDKPKGITSFKVIHVLRKRLHVQKIGHTGTLDPFATGLLVVLVGRNFTKRADEFVADDKEYLATLHLGKSTDTYDVDGQVVHESSIKPTLAELESIIQEFQGTIEQVPPMYSAKKVNGKKLYELARKGQEIERKPCIVHVETKLLRYEYPEVDLHITCSKGCYIRSIGHEIGEKLGSYAYLSALRRIRSGKFRIEDSVPLDPA
jgi:tRNA pseudouridine55 synthase